MSEVMMFVGGELVFVLLCDYLFDFYLCV